MSARVRLHQAAPAVLASALLLVGCGSIDPSSTTTVTTTVDDQQTSAPASGTTSASPTATATINPTEVSTLEGGNGLAIPLLLSNNFLPVGWNSTTPRDSGGFRMSVCGVDLEPSAPVDAAAKRWQRTPTGPFFEQHVRVYDNNTARTVLASLKQSVPSCRRYTATDSRGGSSTFTVSALNLRSADQNTVSWRQRLVPAAPATSAATTATATATPGGSPTGRTSTSTSTVTTSAPVLTQDVAVMRIGSSTVMLVSYAVDENPSVAVLDAAVSAAKTLP